MQWLVDLLVQLVSNAASWVNKAMVAIVEGALTIWPSTPPMIRPGWILAQAQAAMPGAPWWLVGDALQVIGAVVTAVIGWKVAGMIRGA